MELFEQIRLDREREGLSIRALADRHVVHRRAVRQALESPLPPDRKKREGAGTSILSPYQGLIDSWLVGDRLAPRKQRHTAKRVWERLTEEHDVSVSYRTVRAWVAARRRELGMPPEAMVPLVHDPGVEAEVDWGESEVVLDGERVKVFVFHMRACHSGAGFAMAFRNETQQAFLEAHVHAFGWFGGVFGLVRYDNLTSAVKRVLRGRRRVETDRFIALRSHYMFESQFTLVGIRGAHEKGGVEGEVGRFRRRHLVPVPEIRCLSQLNEKLLAGCIGDLGRQITGHQQTVSDGLAVERPLLRALPSTEFDTRECLTPRVDCKALITVRLNRYSVPVCLVGRRVSARLGARDIEIFCDGRIVACHERLSGRYKVRACLDHYLELLKRKPGALACSLPLRQERERGKWPASFDELWAAIQVRYDATQAAKQMIDVLLLCREHPPEKVQLAVRGALTAGASDGRAVALLVSRVERSEPAVIELEGRVGALQLPTPTLNQYDELLTQGATR